MQSSLHLCRRILPPDHRLCRRLLCKALVAQADLVAQRGTRTGSFRPRPRVIATAEHIGKLSMDSDFTRPRACPPPRPALNPKFASTSRPTSDAPQPGNRLRRHRGHQRRVLNRTRMVRAGRYPADMVWIYPVRRHALYRSVSMNLHRLLKRREADKKPLRVALLGAGKFGSMFMSQAARTPGLRLVAVADLSPGRRARRADPGGLAGGRAQRREHRRRAQEQQGLFHRRHRCRHRQPRRRDRGRRHRSGGRRHRARAGLLRTRQAHHHGQRRGRRAGRPAAGARELASSIRWPTATSPR